MKAFDYLSKEDLKKMLSNFAKNWLAHDGLWFQAVENAYGQEQAIALDIEAWKRFSPIEAKRIKTFLNLPEKGGLEALEKALNLRLYAILNEQRSERVGERLRFYMVDCRVQSARKRKGLDDFPCKPVGIVEYSTFAETIDPRIQTRCLTCPPDPHSDDFYCGWEFWVEEEK